MKTLAGFVLVGALPTPARTSSVELSEPSLTGQSEDGESASLRWALVSGATDYEVRYRTGGGAWSCRQLGAQSGAVKAQINLLRKRTYEFQLRAASEGRNAAAYWGPWWFSHEATTDPPAFPGISVGAVTDATVTVSWQHIPGVSDYLIQALHIGGAHNVEQSVSAPAGGVGAVSTTLTGLNPNSTYMVGAMSHGDGNSYVRGWGGWGGWVQTRTAQGYANLVTIHPAIGATNWRCNSPGYPTFDSASWTRNLADGSRHKAVAQLRALPVADLNSVAEEYEAYCLEGIVKNISTPGATTSSWSANLHVGQLAYADIDLSDVSAVAAAIRSLNINALVQFGTREEPSSSDTPDYRTPHSCSTRCKGGTAKTTRVYSRLRMLKHNTFHIFGTHTMGVATETVSFTTEAEFDSPPRIPGEPTVFTAGALSELGVDVAEEVLTAITNAVTGVRDD